LQSRVIFRAHHNDVEGPRRFLEGKVLPWFENRQKVLANRPPAERPAG
jgi:hypothetical protein